MAQLGRHARADDDGRAAAISDDRAHVAQVDAVAQRQRLRCQRVCRLLHRLRLAGQHRLLDPQIDALHQAHVGRHGTARFQQDHVAGHEFAGRKLAPVAAAHDADNGHGQLLQRGHRLLGAILLHKAQDAKQHDDGGDGDRLRRLAQQAGDDGGDDEDEDHRAGKLLPEDAQRVFAAALDQLVRADLLAPPGRFVVAQPAVGIDV